MKISQGFSLRNIAGSNIVVPVGTAGVSFKGMITLNGSGAFLWKQLETDKTEEQLLQAMQAEYEVDEQTAKTDVGQFVGTLRHAGLLE
ncbi:PqqD family protein [Paenibacillus contaminans]|uniref:PqqD family protein n=1 Tax=Paenibacillus contaminans TaxID=450362 RepID=A0A329MLP6_9BACL|nr:PqqD family protein [Paenibacillus contaminans]RAV20725.1 PqqD family protein [Paenibacillus contaminans]